MGTGHVFRGASGSGFGEITQTTYTFTVTSFRITDTRSLHEDTDYVSIAVAVGKNTPITAKKATGNVNNGTHQVNLSISNIDVPEGEVVAFSYSIANSGFAQDTIEQGMQKLVSAAASKTASAAAGAVGGVLGGPAGALITSMGTVAAGWALSQLEGLIFPNCDGIVAAGDHAYSSAQLAAQTASGNTISATDENKGTDSNWGCGGNSHYFVTWSIAAKASVPVLDGTLTTATGAAAGASGSTPATPAGGPRIGVDVPPHRQR